jgi:hypothetical protein
MTKSGYGVLSNQGRYTKFAYNDVVITFLHGKDLIKYLAVKEWDKGYLVVECLGKVKGEYEDYIDLAYIMENLYMDPEESLRDVKGVVIDNA